MRTLINSVILTVLLVVLTICSFAQTTYSPSCYSNAHGWKVTRIERYENRTLVFLSLYSHQQEKFFFHPNLYIENYDNQYGKKLNVKSAGQYQLNTWYTTNPKTQYDFVLEFAGIPNNWININIKEPAASKEYTAWYWNYISLNLPSGDRLKIDNFFLNRGIGFLANSAHPFDTYKSCTYTIDYNEINLTIYYNDGYYTLIKIKNNNGFLSFTRSNMVDYNCDICSPFLGVHLLKQAALKENNYDQFKSNFERYIGKMLNDMNGCDVASLILTLMWLGY